MKVLQINTICGNGSTGRIAVDIYNVLMSKGHNCKIAYGRGNAPSEIEAIKIGNKIDNYLHVIKTRVLDLHGFGSYLATKRLIKDIESYNPDVIHLHNIHGYYINIKILFEYLKNSNKAVVWTLHDCWAFTGHCSHFDYAGCNKWKEECSKCNQRKEYPKSIFFDNSKWNFEEKKKLFTGINNLVIVTPSKWLANLVKQSFLSQNRVEIINNGINLEKFRYTSGDFKTKHRLENKYIILGVASQWIHKKGYDTFLELAKRVNDNYRFILVGVNKKQQNELPYNVIGIEKTNDTRELAEIYSAADIFLNPTLEDNFPTTNLEALACGTPVITYNTGGSGESIDDKCGIVVDKGDINKLVEIILDIENLKFDKKRCSEQSLKYNKINKFNEYIKIYSNISKM